MTLSGRYKTSPHHTPTALDHHMMTLSVLIETPHERWFNPEVLKHARQSVVSDSLSEIEARLRTRSFHLATKITIPAVKITDAPNFPLLPTSSVDSFLPPDTCLSAPTEMKLESIETSIPPLKQQRLLPNLLTDEESEEELGEFLLDAVQWL